ncbi:zinc knuckle [Ostertagia ostertagi]
MQKELSGILQRREYVEQTRNKINAIQESPAERPMQPIRGNRLTCIYCKRFGHQSADCRIIKITERASFLRRNKLCLNCAKPSHTVDVCLSPPCQKCGKMHHVSLCMAQVSQQKIQNPPENRQISTSFTQPVLQQAARIRQPAQNTRNATSKRKAKNTPAINQNAIVQQGSDATVVPNNEKRDQHATGEASRAEVLLLTGTTTILGKNGSKNPILTGHAKKANLTEDDLHVINRKHIQLSSKLDEEPYTPQILLGCDYLWNVMEQQNEMLPSGLYLLPSQESMVNVVQLTNSWINWDRFSSIKKLTRMTAWILRFLRKTIAKLPIESRRRIQKTIPELKDVQCTAQPNAEELKLSRNMLIKVHQRQYKDEISSTAYRKLNIQKNDDGIWACHGRLGQSDLSENTKKPIFVVPNSILARLIIQQAHGKMHLSTAHTMAEEHTPRVEHQHPYNLRPRKPKPILNINIITKKNNILEENKYGDSPTNVSDFSMEAQMDDVKKLLQQIALRPRAVINDKILQEHLMAINNGIDKLLKRAEDVVGQYREAESTFVTANVSPMKAYNKRRIFDQQLTELQTNLHCAGYVSELLWNTYDEMVKAKVAMVSKKDHFAAKILESGRPIDKTSTRVYITSELRSIGNVITEIREIRYQPWARNEQESLIDHVKQLQLQVNHLVKVDCNNDSSLPTEERQEGERKQGQMEKVAKKTKEISTRVKALDDSIITWQAVESSRFDELKKDMENFQNKMEERIENALKTIAQQMMEQMKQNVKEPQPPVEVNDSTPLQEDTLILLEDDMEVMQMAYPPDKAQKAQSPKESLRGIEEATQRSKIIRKGREYDPDEVTARHPAKVARVSVDRTPARVSQAKQQLKYLRECQPRKIGDSKTTLCTSGARVVICDFCRKRGKHTSDACTTFPTVKERRDLIKEEEMCRRCLRSRCGEKCEKTVRCGYCGDRTHHEALCNLPDERQELNAILNEYDKKRWRECAERDPH